MPGYLAGVRELTRPHGVLLINDETHTFCAGPGGATAAWDLEPDLVTIGKAIGGGIPAAAYGLSADIADRLLARTDLDLIDMGGVGGTLAGNPLSVAAVCATLGEVLVDDAFDHMIALAERSAADPGLDDYLHTYLANRGILLTPFHNMALMSPVTTAADVDAHTKTFDEAVSELLEA